MFVVDNFQLMVISDTKEREKDVENVRFIVIILRIFFNFDFFRSYTSCRIILRCRLDASGAVRVFNFITISFVIVSIITITFYALTI